MKYICTECNYKTNDKSNYNKHLSSKLHESKSISDKQMTFPTSQNSSELLETLKMTEIKCNFCGQKFARNSNLTKHKQICMDAKLQEKEKELQEKDKETEIKLLKQELNHLKNDNKKLGTFCEELKQFISSGRAGSIYNISVKKYIQQNYSDAPHLATLPFSEYAKLSHEPYLKSNDDNQDDIDDSEESIDENDKLIMMLIHNYNNNILHEFLGNFIIGYYKKEDPSQQAIWNSDVSRLTYIIKELFSNNIESQWNADYKGVKTNHYVITPLLKHIRKCIDEYWIKSVDSFKNLDIKSLEALQHELILLGKIKQDISNNTLANNIIKYMAPEFYMNKGNDIVEVSTRFIDK